MGELRDKEPLPSRPFSKSVLAVGWVAHSLKIYQTDEQHGLGERSRRWLGGPFSQNLPGDERHGLGPLEQDQAVDQGGHGAFRPTHDNACR